MVYDTGQTTEDDKIFKDKVLVSKTIGGGSIGTIACDNCSAILYDSVSAYTCPRCGFIKELMRINLPATPSFNFPVSDDIKLPRLTNVVQRLTILTSKSADDFNFRYQG